MDLMSTAQLLGNLGEFVGAIAVVVTLGYLAVQVRHSNVQSRATAAIAIVQGWQRTQIEVASSETLGRDLMEVLVAKDSSEVRPLAIFRAVSYLQCGMKNAELCYLQYQNGSVDEQVWIAARDSALGILAVPSIRQLVWPLVMPSLAPQFLACVEALLPDIDFVPPEANAFSELFREKPK